MLPGGRARAPRSEASTALPLGSPEPEPHVLHGSHLEMGMFSSPLRVGIWEGKESKFHFLDYKFVFLNMFHFYNYTLDFSTCVQLLLQIEQEIKAKQVEMPQMAGVGSGEAGWQQPKAFGKVCRESLLKLTGTAAPVASDTSVPGGLTDICTDGAKGLSGKES